MNSELFVMFISNTLKYDVLSKSASLFARDGEECGRFKLKQVLKSIALYDIMN